MDQIQIKNPSTMDPLALEMEFRSTMDPFKMENQSRQQTIFEVKLNQLQDMISTEETEDKMSVVLVSLQKLSDDLCDRDFWKAFMNCLKRYDLNKLSYVYKLIVTLKSVRSTQSEEFDFYLMIYILKKLLHKEDVKLLCIFVNANFKKIQSMIDAVKKKNWPDGKKTLYEVLLHLLQYMNSKGETEDKMSVVLLGSLQKLSDDFCDEDFWEAFKSCLQRCDLNKLSSVCKLIDTLKSVSSAQSVEFDFFLIYILKKLLCGKSFEVCCGRRFEMFCGRSFEVLCGFVKDNFKTFKSMMDAVKMKNQSDEKQTLYEVLLHLLQDMIFPHQYRYMLSREETEDKMSVVLLGSLQKLSDDFCDEDFWKVFKRYLQNCDLNKLYYVHKLIDTLKSVSSTQSVEFDFFFINILIKLLCGRNVDVFCERSYDVFCGKTFQVLCDFAKDNFKTFKSIMDAVKMKNQSDEKQTLYEVLLHLLQYMISRDQYRYMLSTEETEDKMSVVLLLGSLQKLSDDFSDEDFLEAFKRYLKGCHLKKLSSVFKLIDNLKSITFPHNEELESHLIYFFKRLMCERGVRKLYAFIHNNYKCFQSMIDVIKRKNETDKKQNLYRILLPLLKYMISTGQTERELIEVLESLGKVSENFSDTDFWVIYKSYLQRCDLTTFTSVCRLIDNLKSISSSPTEDFEVHWTCIMERRLCEKEEEHHFPINFIATVEENRNIKTCEKRTICHILLCKLKHMISMDQTDGEINFVLRSLQKVSNDFSDEDFWKVFRQYLLRYDLRDVSSLAKLIGTLQTTSPTKTKKFEIYYILIIKRILNEKDDQEINVPDKSKTKLHTQQTLYQTLLYLDLLQYRTSTDQPNTEKSVVLRLLQKMSADFSDVNFWIIFAKYIKKFKLTKQSYLPKLIHTLKRETEERLQKKRLFFYYIKEQMEKLSRLCVLIMCMLLLVTSSIGKESAQLKKYLALKYENDKAILYLLWCSGDIEINPGPPTKKGQLIHDSEKERKWIQDMSSTLLKLYREVSFTPKTNNLWKEKPEHWPSSKPFYDTKNKSKDENGGVITDKDLLTCLIECCKKKNVTIPVQCQFEINAWKDKEKWLLFKLHTYRTETKKIKSAFENLMFININSLFQLLKDINVSLHVESGVIFTINQADRRTKSQAEMVADITRCIAIIVCKIIKGMDLEKKCDGIWNEPPDKWPQDSPFFDPNNRGKCRDRCSDQKLTETLLQHPKAIIPPKWKDLVATFQTMVKPTTDTKKHRAALCKIHRAALCKIYETQINIPKLDNALQYLHDEGLFKQEVHDILQQLWTTQQVDNSKIEKMSQSQKCTHERPEVLIRITHDSIKLCAKPCDETCQTNTTIDYTIPVARNPLNLTIAQANNQQSASTSCNRSHDIQQNQLQTESTGNQQGSPSHADINCSKNNQPDVSVNHLSQKNSSNEQSGSKDDSELPHPTAGTSNTQTVFINTGNTDILQSTAKPKTFNRGKGSPTKPDKYKSKKISSTVLLIKKCPVKKASKNQNRPQDNLEQSDLSGILGSQEHLQGDCKKSRNGSLHNLEESNSITSQNVSSMILNNQQCSEEIPDTLQSSKQLPRTDDVDHGLVSNSTTTNDEDRGLGPNSSTIDDTDHRPATISPTTDDSQKRKPSIEESIPCRNKMPHVETDKKKRKPAIDESLPCNSKKPRLETDNTDDDTYNADETLPRNNIQLIDLDFLSNDLDLYMANILLKPKENTNPDQCKNSSEIDDKQSQLNGNDEIETFLTDMIDYESGKKSDIEKELSLDM